jgi:RNA polymerase sigma factor (sigma-70 family)
MERDGSTSHADGQCGDRSTRSSQSPDPWQWPARLREIAQKLRDCRERTPEKELLEAAWRILYRALSIYLRSHAGRLGGVSREDLEDLASEKALDLLLRIVSGSTEFVNRSSSEIASYFSRVAKNELLDLLKSGGRRVEPKNEDRPEWDIGESEWAAAANPFEAPDLPLERREFASALRQCAEQLDPRRRLMWFFRVFYQMPSRLIASHPEVSLKPSHVDVILQRIRRTIRDCMRRKGFESQDIPTGVFVELWRAFRLGEIGK